MGRAASAPERHRVPGGVLAWPARLRPPADAHAPTLLATRDAESIALAYGPGARAGRRLQQRPREQRRAPGDQSARAPAPGRGARRRARAGDRRPLTDPRSRALERASDRLVVAWGSQDSGEEASRPWVERAAVAPPARSFGRCLVLDPGGAETARRGALAAAMSDADSAATVAWTNVSGAPGADDVPAAHRDPRRRAGDSAPTEVSPNWGRSARLAVTTEIHADRAICSRGPTRRPANAEPHPPYDVFAALRPAAHGPPSARPSASRRPELDDGGRTRSPRSAPRPARLVASPAPARERRGSQLASRRASRGTRRPAA